MKVKEENTIFQELSAIITPIFSKLKLEIDEEPNAQKISFEQSIEKLKALNTDNDNNELNLYINFIKNLFLNNNNNFEFDISGSYKYIEPKEIKDIFIALKNNLIKQDFFQFLVDIGEIFSKINVEYDDNEINNIEDSLSNQKLTNYECILELFQKCKKNRRKFLYENFDDYYPISYIKEISNNLCFSIYISNKIYIAGQN